MACHPLKPKPNGRDHDAKDQRKRIPSPRASGCQDSPVALVLVKADRVLSVRSRPITAS